MRYALQEWTEHFASQSLEIRHSTILHTTTLALRPLLEKGDVCLAGGFVRSILEGRPGAFGDIDVFCFHAGAFSRARSLLQQRTKCSKCHSPPRYSLESKEWNKRTFRVAAMAGLVLPESWLVKFGREDPTPEDREDFYVNLIYYPGVRSLLANPLDHIFNLLDNFDFNATRVALLFTDFDKPKLVIHPYAVWDISTTTITFNETAVPGLPVLRWSKKLWWNPAALGHRLHTYVALYQYAVDFDSFRAYISLMKRHLANGTIHTSRSNPEQAAEILDRDVKKFENQYNQLRQSALL